MRKKETLPEPLEVIPTEGILFLVENTDSFATHTGLVITSGLVYLPITKELVSELYKLRKGADELSKGLNLGIGVKTQFKNECLFISNELLEYLEETKRISTKVLDELYKNRGWVIIPAFNYDDWDEETLQQDNEHIIVYNDFFYFETNIRHVNSYLISNGLRFENFEKIFKPFKRQNIIDEIL